MNYEGLILACNANDFNNKLTDLIAKDLGNLALNWNTYIMAIQFKDADEYAIAPLIDAYRRSDGQYVREGEFLTRQEVHDQVQPFCKRICISVAPKDFGDNQEHPLEDFHKKYGYIHFTQINTIK